MFEVSFDRKGKHAFVDTTTITQGKRIEATETWTKPAWGWGKLNFDAVLNSQGISKSALF
jgi:hypothetical protein